MEDQPKSRIRRTTARIQQQSMDLLRSLRRSTLSPLDNVPPAGKVAEGTRSEATAKPAPTPVHGKVTCPGCGQVNPVGYVSCPKCKHKLPQRAPTSGRKLKQGGTSSAAASGLSIGVVLICVAFTIAASYLAYRELPEVRGEKIVNKDRAVARQANANGTDAAAKAPEGEGDKPEAAPAPAPVLPPGTTPSIVLENKLRASGIASWVDVDITDPSYIVIRTANCGNPNMQATIMQATEILRTSFSGVRCVERFNRVAFEQRL